MDTTNHTPTTPTSQARPTERPAGTQGHEPCLRLCPFPSFQRLRAGNGSNKRHHRAQSKRADRSTIALRDMPCRACVCSTARYHHTSSRTISPSLQIAHVVSEHKSTSTSFETLVTKKPIVAITTFAHRDPTSKTTKRLRLAFCPLPKPVPSTLSTLRPVRLLRARPKNLRPFPRELGRIFSRA